jgi:hypothetical protein
VSERVGEKVAAACAFQVRATNCSSFRSRLGASAAISHGANVNIQTRFFVAIIGAATVIESTTADAQSISPTYREISVVGTSAEMPLVRAVSDRLRSRFSGDAAFVKQLHDALNQKRQSDAIKLIAQVVQVPDAEIVLGQVRATSSAHSNAPRMIPAAAAHGEMKWSVVTFTPWWIIIETRSYVICAGTNGDCTKELRRRGLIP